MDIIFEDKAVEARFEGYLPIIKTKLLVLRQLILQVAAETPAVGRLEETLKWGQPSYLTPETKSGSTIRIDRVGSDSTQYAMYFNCKTTLIETFKGLYPDDFTYDGTRAIIFDVNDELDLEAVKHCIWLTLTYHLNKKARH